MGLEAALGELPRSGKPRQVSDDAIAWIQNLACQKPKDLGYAQELWTYQLLTAHVRREAPAAGHGELSRLSRSKLHKVLAQGELKPHKVRYYVERRDPEFDQKMAAVLHVYKEVEILNQGLVTGTIDEPATVTVSYDESRGFRLWVSRLRTGRRCPECIPVICGTTNTSASAPCLCWLASTCTPAG